MIAERSISRKLIGFSQADGPQYVNYVNVDHVLRVYKIKKFGFSSEGESMMQYRLDIIDGKSFDISESVYKEILDIMGVIMFCS